MLKSFLRVSEAEKSFAFMAEQAMTQMMTQVEKQMSKDGYDLDEEDTEKFNEAIRIVKKAIPEIINVGMNIYADLFSDEEINELIALNLSPIAVRLRELQPEIYERSVKLSNEIIGKKIEKLFSN